ncbi:Protein of unknown function [Paramicrobacterium humi]|uniref:DUF2795 domain-containing protein n=1 Tax=Paramicrobacterium humi TaxID=640635 RepID=A0A1H4IRZ2_9MICO|nr:DUF2795 domain-containing protein [Microbacterium humi]SEB36615.1 Protein of unknown function [Microbacterium humi]
MVTLSPSLSAFLRGMEYPCDRDDLLRQAAREGLPLRDSDMLSSLDDRTYSSRRDITRAFRRPQLPLSQEERLVAVS